MTHMDRQLGIESVEGEIALVIEYQPGKSEALSVLSGAMRLIESLDSLDRTLYDVQTKANQAKRGLWVDRDPVPPWVWRKQLTMPFAN